MEATIFLSEQAVTMIQNANNDLKMEYAQYVNASEEDRPIPSALLNTCLAFQERCDIVLCYSNFTEEELFALILPNMKQLSGTIAIELIALIPEQGLNISDSNRRAIEGQCIACTAINTSGKTATLLLGIVNDELQDAYQIDLFANLISKSRRRRMSTCANTSHIIQRNICNSAGDTTSFCAAGFCPRRN